jgi:hypothetical protein
MKSFFLSILIIFITIFFILLIFLSQPQLRHITFTGLVQFPEFATMQAMKGGLITRDFDRVMPWLDRQLQLTTYYGRTKNKMTPGLLENIRQAYKIAVLKEERERFIPLLENAYKLNPENIDLNLMLASANQFLDPDKSLEYLEKAKLILPSDQRIYHLANIILLDSKNTQKKMSWCQDYLRNQFGDYAAGKSSTLLGVGYRRLAFEFSVNETRELFLNEGVVLGKRLQYEFTLDSLKKIKNPSIRVANGGGIKVSLHGLSFFSQGNLLKSYDSKSILLYPETGYLVEGKVISTNTYGENIYLNFLSEDEIIADKILVDLTISKLPINNLVACSL